MCLHVMPEPKYQHKFIPNSVRHSLSGQILQTWDIVDISWFIYLDLCVLITLKYCQQTIQLILTVVSTYFHQLDVYLKHKVIWNKERSNIKGYLSMF